MCVIIRLLFIFCYRYMRELEEAYNLALLGPFVLLALIFCFSAASVIAVSIFFYYL